MTIISKEKATESPDEEGGIWGTIYVFWRALIPKCHPRFLEISILNDLLFLLVIPIHTHIIITQLFFCVR